MAALGLDYRGDNARLSADLGWQDNQLEQTRSNVTLSGVSRVPDAPVKVKPCKPTNSLKVDGFTTLDLGARYTLDLGSSDVTFKGKVINVTGEDYWKSVGGYPNNGYLNAGEPTSVKVSATIDF